MAASSRPATVFVPADDNRDSERPRSDRHLGSSAAALVALLLLLAAAAFADERDDVEKLKAFRDLNPDRPVTGHSIQWHLGYFEFRALGMDWRIFYLPLLAPLPGSGFQNTANIPNAFEQTQTPYA